MAFAVTGREVASDRREALVAYLPAVVVVALAAMAVLGVLVHRLGR